MNLIYQAPGTFPLFEKILRLLIGEGLNDKSVIDLCCNEATVTRKLKAKQIRFVDVNDWGAGQFGEFHQVDVLGEHPIFHDRYDVSLCLDGIEHLHRSSGLALLERMNQISDKQILFTPLGDDDVKPWSDNPNDHKCGWLPQDLPGYGCLSFPKYHHAEKGAFFFWKAPNMEEDFERVKQALKKDRSLK